MHFINIFIILNVSQNISVYVTKYTKYGIYPEGISMTKYLICFNELFNTQTHIDKHFLLTATLYILIFFFLQIFRIL